MDYLNGGVDHSVRNKMARESRSMENVREVETLSVPQNG